MSDRLQAASARDLRGAREEEWRRLESIVSLAERRSFRKLSDSDLMELPVLYRAALSSLSVARETSLDLELITYLEGLCARAYFFVYGVRTSPWRRLGHYFARDWGAAVRALWLETSVAVGLLLIGAIAAFLLVSADPVWYSSFVSPDLAGGRDFSASAAGLRATLYDEPQGVSLLSIFATYLFTHNSQVAILCFALGFAFGVPTIMLLIHTGGMLGAIFALFAKHGLALELGGWLIIHGSTELFAIAIAGAAGLRIGWSMVFPGEQSRLIAGSQAGKTAGLAMVGVILMLLVAGLLEGLGRQLITSDAVRYGIGVTVLGAWLTYFYVARQPQHG